MTTLRKTLAGTKVIKVTISGSDLDFTAANTTAQPKVVATLPAKALIQNVTVFNSGVALAGTDWTAFNVTAGIASGGTTIFTAADLKASGAVKGSNSVQTASLSSTTTVFVGFAPAGGNWAAVTSTTADVEFTVYIHWIELEGSEYR